MSDSNYKQLGDLLSIGIMFPACIAFGYGIGYVLDFWVGTKSVFKVSFLLFGIAAGFINLFKIVNRINRDEDGHQ